MIGIKRIVLGSVVAACLAPAPALADTTIGDSSSGGNLNCGGHGEVVDTGYVVPTRGTITSLSSSAFGGQMDLQVLQPNGGDSYTVVGNTGLQTFPGGEQTFPVDITVHGGEVLGMYIDSGGLACGYIPRADSIGIALFSADPAVGSTFQTAVTAPGGALNVSANLHPSAAPLTASGTPVAATEGRQFSGEVATFGDDDDQPLGDYTATIDWGDGTSSAGTISRTGTGRYAVSGSHVYAEEGVHPVTVSITDADGTTVNADSSATVADAPISADGRGTATNPVLTDTAFAGPVATVSDENPLGTAGEFTATIDWGDGTSSAGTVTGSDGSYTVDGSHAYAETGPYAVTVHVADDGGSTADATTHLLVYGSPAGGGFVTGDGGPHVYFWGSQWAKHNGGPASFKGFAGSGAARCGDTFTARPGQSAAAPASVPAYLAVAVTSSVAKSGARISGTVEKLVVVRTDPSAPGTGDVVATICGV